MDDAKIPVWWWLMVAFWVPLNIGVLALIVIGTMALCRYLGWT